VQLHLLILAVLVVKGLFVLLTPHSSASCHQEQVRAIDLVIEGCFISNLVLVSGAKDAFGFRDVIQITVLSFFMLPKKPALYL